MADRLLASKALRIAARCSARTSRRPRRSARISLSSGLPELGEVIDGKSTTFTNSEGSGVPWIAYKQNQLQPPRQIPVRNRVREASIKNALAPRPPEPPPWQITVLPDRFSRGRRKNPAHVPGLLPVFIMEAGSLLPEYRNNFRTDPKE